MQNYSEILLISNRNEGFLSINRFLIDKCHVVWLELIENCIYASLEGLHSKFTVYTISFASQTEMNSPSFSFYML